MALPTQADVVTNPLAAAQFSNLYGPQTQQALRRSQYLADALKENINPQQNPRSGAEVAARLLATAILQHANNKSQDALIQAMRADQSDETAKALAGLGPAPAASPGSLVSPSTLPAPSGGPQGPGMNAPTPASSSVPTSAPQADAMPDADRLAIARAVYGEARGEPAAGQQGVASVILNRAHATGQSPSQVVAAPHQFAGYNPQTQNLTPDQLAPVMANISGVIDGSVPDPTGGADHFFNPQLANPSWGQGPGQMIGQHKFVQLNDQRPAPGAQMTGTPPVAPAPQAPPPAQPYQVASNGPTPPPPSAPGSSPPGPGTPPAALLPQASPAGGNSQPQWPTWKPSQAEYEYVQGLLMDPRTHAQGVQVAQQMRQKMTQPVAAKIVQMNGVSFYVPEDPTAGAPTMAIPVPKEAMTQHLDGAAAGMPAGTQIDQNPLGQRNVVSKPPDGYQSAGNGRLQYQPGGPADPTRPQTPAQGYQFNGAPGAQQGAGAVSAAGGAPGAPMSQAPISGGPADPRSPMNLAEGTQRVQNALRPTIDLAIVARQSYGAVGAGYKQQNGTGDIAMVNGLQHLIDKGVVRGEDVNMQMKAAGIAGGLGQLVQYINSDGLLSPDVRNKAMLAARDLFNNIDSQYRSQVMSHRATVDAVYGPGSFDKYVVPAEQQQALGWVAHPASGGAPHAAGPDLKPGTRAAAEAEARRRGLIK